MLSKQQLQKVLFFCFNMKNNAAEALLEQVYCEYELSKTICED